MKVYKFGGASIKDSTSIRNLAKILKSESSQKLVIVISAMGKMTNAFEQIVAHYQSNSDQLETAMSYVQDFHLNMIKELFPENHVVKNEIEELFLEIHQFILINKQTDYDYVYDQIVSYGELLSTKIISHFLALQGMDTTWLDARTIVITDTNYRNANIDWQQTCQNIQHSIQDDTVYITQGFIAGSKHASTTTLGREGSDYSAAIFSYCLGAESLSIWKDVPGVYNADPRYFKNPKLIKQLSYREVLEMAFYGASVIHPKTIKPLENKGIPLYVRSFAHPEDEGTTIKKGIDLIPKTACYTIKNNQILLSISARDFSFIIEKNISMIFDLFARYRIKVNLIQNSAISFSVCIEDMYNSFESLLKELQDLFYVTYNKEVQLISIRHFTRRDIEKIKKDYSILLSQQTSKTLQFIVK